MVAGSGLDAFLNIFIPLLIIGFFAGMIYKGTKPQADALFKWVGEKFKSMLNSAAETNTSGYKSVIVYE